MTSVRIKHFIFTSATDHRLDKFSQIGVLKINTKGLKDDFFMRTHLRAGDHHLLYGIAQTNAICLNPCKARQYLISLPWRDERLS